MKANYDEALKRLLDHEGGYTNHPDDPGGPTNFGITIHDYTKYIKSDGTAEDVKSMSLDDAKAIYRAKYWDALKCDDLPAGVDYAVFDFGVNSGVLRAATYLQRILNVTVDGSIGPKTILAANEADKQTLVERLCDERLKFLEGLRTWPTFGKGWGRRVREVRAAATVMAAA